jgi:LPXTG-site transpeptidase (sortase) family protein
MKKSRKQDKFLKGGAPNLKERKVRKILFSTLPVALMLGGIYILSLAYAPKLVPLLKSGEVAASIEKSLPDPNSNRIYIQKLGVNVPILEGGPEVMKEGSWHRFPERGSPTTGGNFIISAHRWKTGKTPAETIAQSPFYNADQLKNGDEIFVDYKGKRYKYVIYDTFGVKPDQVEIENSPPEGDAYLTLYTCTLGGSNDGRVVIRARLAESL